jgi:hypothetical protein
MPRRGKRRVGHRHKRAVERPRENRTDTPHAGGEAAAKAAGRETAK